MLSCPPTARVTPPIPGRRPREGAGATRDRTLSTAVETPPPPVIHLHIQPSSGQRMHRNTEASPPQGVDARHALHYRTVTGSGGGLAVLGGGGPRLYGLLHFRNDTRWQRKTEPMEALQYAATWGHRGRALD